ncbi:type VII secretion protein EccCa [Gordonia sp. ABSL1-1]|uniref:type VII secretion protein EccCa n=1 Tax=Gordonia sp. ABSL1-1 TaxID=3053923 RepID=UPI002572E1CD|nr:type VII secretion protein EccCa [Gordonia sp. ABSL1-1]MDL9937749.1 type VII secretion protein EccCa [Gordonia sp. ABSL1-1]
MGTEGFVRRPRITAPKTPGGEVDLQAPPEVPRVIPGNILMKLMPLVMLVAVIGMIALMFTVGGRSIASNPMMMMFPMMMIMSMVGMFMGGAGQKSGKAASELNEERKDYFRYLTNLRSEVDATGEEQRAALEWAHPDPRILVDLAGSRRMWERRPDDADYCHVRVGVGTQRLATRLLAPETGPTEDLEPVSTVALRRFVRTHAVVHALPTAVSLRRFPAINVEGDRMLTRQLVRSMLVELCMFHGPEHIQVAVITTNPDGEAWQWLKWLPQAQNPDHLDGIGPMRMLFSSLSKFETVHASEFSDRGRFSRNASPAQGVKQFIVILDDGYVSGDERLVTEAGLDSVTVLDLNAPKDGLAVRRGLQLVVEEDSIAVRSAAGIEKFAKPDALSVAEAEAAARRIGRYRPANAAQHIVSLEAETRGAVVDPGLMSMLKIEDAAEIVPEEVWRPRSPRERLRVPIGITPGGQLMELDIKEAAENGMGPHGLCIGATGSGKSEFLRTLVLSMITSHSPEALNLVLVDFKGGATFLGLDEAPHVAAVITNLEEEITMVDRMRDALSGEMNRRQELLRSAGNFANVGDYERARANGAALDPLPALFIVVDEFSELLSQKPDFAELFVMIGRLGRSLHMHLLLASQRLEEGKLRGLDSHLSYRIGLKTFSAGESRQVLGVPDAYHLPSVPGSAFLKSDADEPKRFNASYVSGPYVKPRAQLGGTRHSVLGALAPKLFTVAHVDKPQKDLTDSTLTPEEQAELRRYESELKAAESGNKPSLLDVVVGRLKGHGRPAHEVWLPPLEDSPAVNDLLPAPDWRDPANINGALWMPMGILDRPYDQRRDVLAIDLFGAAGNVAIVGGPQSGKSNALRTMVVSGAMTHTPEQLQFYCLDFGGGTLVGLQNLPHVGGVAGRMDTDKVNRTVAEVSTVLREREERFRELGIESMRDFRQRKARLAALPPAERAADPLSQDLHGDVVLVIDGWASIRSDFEPLEPKLIDIALQGLSYGVHLAVSASRWMEIRPNVKDMLGTRLELKLGDPSDSDIDRKVQALIPENRPGRGIGRERLHLLLGLPRIDSDTSVETLPAGVQAMVNQVGEFYGPRRAPQVRMLPAQLDQAEVLAVAHREGSVSKSRIAIGIDEAALAPVVVDFDAQGHLVVFAEAESGKTTLLRNIAQGVVRNATPDQAKVIMVDYRRGLLGAIEGDHLGGYATSEDSATKLMNNLAGLLKLRLPPDDVTQQQLQERSWWSGPDIYLLIDDYDLVATSHSNPLSPLVPYLAQARDIGLRVVVTRRVGGAGRALYDPFVGRLKDLSCNGLIMGGTKDEGVLLGNFRPHPMPPGRGMFISRTQASGMIQLMM